MLTTRQALAGCSKSELAANRASDAEPRTAAALFWVSVAAIAHWRGIAMARRRVPTARGGAVEFCSGGA